MAESTRGKMNWKAILAVVLVLAIIGFIFFSGIGSKYIPQLGLGSLVSLFPQQKPSSIFAFSLVTTSTAFIGQDYKLVNASFDATGLYQSITAGSLYLTSKQGNEITISLRNFNGDFQISTGGVTLKGTATYAEFGDIAASADKTISIQLAMIPSNYTLSSLQENTMNFSGIGGSVQRGNGSNVDVVNLYNSSLTINYFAGSLTKQSDGTAILSGTASSVKGDTFSFV